MADGIGPEYSAERDRFFASAGTRINEITFSTISRGRNLGSSDLELAGLDLRQVEDVVDDPQQMVAVAPDGPGRFGAARVGCAVGQHVGESQNGRQRRADLVAHVGQELALGPVCRLGFLLRRGQLAEDSPAFGDVSEDINDPFDFPASL